MPFNRILVTLRALSWAFTVPGLRIGLMLFFMAVASTAGDFILP